MSDGDVFLGYLFSAYGLRTWDGWRTAGRILFLRHPLSRTVRLSAWQYLGFPPDPARPASATHRDIEVRIEGVAAVSVRRPRMSYPELHLEKVDGTVLEFGIFDGNRVDEIRARLGDLGSDRVVR